MAINTSIPWGGTTGHGGGYSALEWQQMQLRLMASRDGVITNFDDELIVEESTPNTMTVTVGEGSAVVQGIYVYNDDPVTVAITANTSGNPRIDLIVLQVDWATQVASFAAVAGTPDASPVVPSPTQTSGTLWQLVLATVDVADSATTVTSGEIEDWRVYHHPGKYVGDMQPWPSLTPPSGALILDGRAVSRERYADLYAVMGTAFGVGNGSTTFNLPDMRGRTLAGLDDMGTGEGAADVVTDSAADAIGGEMGEETHTLTEAELASHVHLVLGSTSDGGTYASQKGNNTSTQRDTSSTGGDAPHNNMQPTVFVNWICWF